MSGTYTEADAREWIAQEADAIERGFDNFNSIPDWMRRDCKFKTEVWPAGCWLNAKLAEHGATPEQAVAIGFAHGQRSLFGDPIKWAVKYLNEFVANGEVRDQPGISLADQINNEALAWIRPERN